jgi:GT2 family glycosyltransferase
MDIVIVNYNAGAQLQACIASLGGKNAIVIDCGEPSGYPFAHACANRGFGAACNLGAGFGDDELILFLNPDVRVLPGTLDKAETALKAQPRCAILGVRLFGNDGKTQPSRIRFIRTRHFILRTKLAGYYDTNETSGWCDCILGAFMLVRRSVFEALGGFDERFFLYFEEVDLALRAHALGFGCFYLGEACAVHSGGGTTAPLQRLRTYHSIRSRFLYALKHFKHYMPLVLYTLLAELPLRLLIRPNRRDTLYAYITAAKTLKELKYETGRI